MSEALFLINPRPRKGRMPPALRKYWASRRKKNPRRRRNAHRRKIYVSHRRRNPARAHRRRRRNPARSYRRSHRRRRNPIFARRRRRHNPIRRYHRRRRNPIGGSWGDALTPAAIGAGGAIALAVAYGYVSPYLPSNFTTGSILPLVVQAAGALGLGALAYAITKNARMSQFVATGGLTVVAVNAVTPMLSSATGGTLPGLSGFGGLKLGGAYTPYRRSMGAYMPWQRPGAGGRLGFINPAARLGAYMRTPARLEGFRGVGAYLPNSVPGMRGFGRGGGGYTGLQENDNMGM